MASLTTPAPFLPQSTAPAARSGLCLNRLLRLLLLGDATRSEIAKHTGFSQASVTLGSRWLMEHGFVENQILPSSGAGRPTELLSLRQQPWLAVALQLSARQVSSHVINSLGTTLTSLTQKITAPNQRKIMQAVTAGIEAAHHFANGEGKTIYGVGMSVDGTVSDPDPGIIYSLNGIRNWVAAGPRHIHPALHALPFATQWTRSTCKLHGLARALKTDDHIGYFDIGKRDLHLAFMYQGIVTLGRLGTSGHFLHQSVAPTGPDCFCGRIGCLSAMLREGSASPATLFGAIQRLIEQRNIHHLGIEWPGGPKLIHNRFLNASLHSTALVEDGDSYERDGLALLTAEVGLLQQISRQQERSGNH